MGYLELSESRQSRPDLIDLLTKEQINCGFYLEGDEDFIYLYDRESNLKGVFSSQGANIKAIREEVDRLITDKGYQ